VGGWGTHSPGLCTNVAGMGQSPVTIIAMNQKNTYYIHILKVVSSENYGGSKIAPIVAYWPETVGLGIILNF
jgi:hypothetical protein